MENLNQKLKILQNAINVIGLTMATVLFFNVNGNLHIHWIAIILESSMIFVFCVLNSYNKKKLITFATVFIFGILLTLANRSRLMESARELKNWYLEHQKTNDNYQIT